MHRHVQHTDGRSHTNTSVHSLLTAPRPPARTHAHTHWKRTFPSQCTWLSHIHLPDPDDVLEFSVFDRPGRVGAILLCARCSIAPAAPRDGIFTTPLPDLPRPPMLLPSPLLPSCCCCSFPPKAPSALPPPPPPPPAAESRPSLERPKELIGLYGFFDRADGFDGDSRYINLLVEDDTALRRCGVCGELGKVSYPPPPPPPPPPPAPL